MARRLRVVASASREFNWFWFRSFGLSGTIKNRSNVFRLGAEWAASRPDHPLVAMLGAGAELASSRSHLSNMVVDSTGLECRDVGGYFSVGGALRIAAHCEGQLRIRGSIFRGNTRPATDLGAFRWLGTGQELLVSVTYWLGRTRD